MTINKSIFYIILHILEVSESSRDNLSYYSSKLDLYFSEKPPITVIMSGTLTVWQLTSTSVSWPSHTTCTMYWLVFVYSIMYTETKHGVLHRPGD